MNARSSALAGGVVGGVALVIVASSVGINDALGPDAVSLDRASGWLQANLGGAVWPFLLVLGAYAAHLGQLSDMLQRDPPVRRVVQFDQLVDVWIHLFVGIGVIWTAIGMRSALQAALGNTDAAFNDTAGDVLQRLVDGGILLALSTTIVGGIGGYLMRLGKTLYLGAGLHAFYENAQHADIKELVASVRHLEHMLDSTRSESNDPSSVGTGTAP